MTIRNFQQQMLPAQCELKVNETNPESFILKVSLTFPLFLCTSISFKDSGSYYAAATNSASSSKPETFILLIFQGADWATIVWSKCNAALASTSKTAPLGAQNYI